VVAETGKEPPKGFAWLPEDDFANHFAADVDPVTARIRTAAEAVPAAT
jgi:hypothetical protein